MFVQGWLSLHTCICPHSTIHHNLNQRYHLSLIKEKEIEKTSPYDDISTFNSEEHGDYDKEGLCKCGCRLRAIIRLVISSLGFTFLVSGIVVAVIGSSDEGLFNLTIKTSNQIKDSVNDTGTYYNSRYSYFR